MQSSARCLLARNENWVVRAPGGVERIEARFRGRAFAPHRHDTYAIGITLEGVQSFDYRGSTRHSRPGQLVILHPDEVHDGRSGDDGAFRYRTAYIAPAAIQGALGGQALPFVAGGLSNDARLHRPIMALLEDCERPLGELETADILYDLAFGLLAVSGDGGRIARANRVAAERARDYIDAHVACSFSLTDLECITGHDRWQLSRDFRCLFGTSPYRYLIQRRIDKARRLLLAGRSAAEAASRCGFADQSHFGRLFKKSVGLTPQAWRNAILHDRSIRRAPDLPN
jgi:AraC-like DNA-binding protein